MIVIANMSRGYTSTGAVGIDNTIKKLLLTMLVISIFSRTMAVYILLANKSNASSNSRQQESLLCDDDIKYYSSLVRNVSFEFCRRSCDYNSCACFDYKVAEVNSESSTCRIALKENLVTETGESYSIYERIPLTGSVIDVSLSISDEVIANTSDTFRMIGVNFDFWPSSKSKWEKSGALEIDLSNRRLKTLASGLNGSLLRMGGSPADMLLYETYPDACSKENLNKTQKHGSGYYCPIWDQVEGQCLTMERWKELNIFASQTGLQIAFDLNACWGRYSATDEMNFTMIEGLIRATSIGKDDWARVFAFEFGNELYTNVAADRYASDLKHIRGLIEKYWGSKNKSVPKLLGPDCGAGYMGNHYLDSMLTAAEGNKTLHAVTVHLYGENGNCGRHLLVPGFVLNVSCMDSLTKGIMNTYKETTRKHGVLLWDGEAALTGSSGKPGLTNVFTSSFWYINTMASFAQAGIGLVSRQTLVGGDYELIDKATFTPNPDYWALLLWHRLSGTTALRSDWLKCGEICLKCLRTYSRKSLKGRKLTIVINFCVQQSFAINIRRNQGDKEINQSKANFANIYQLTGLLSSRVIKLNNKELVYDGGDRLPDIVPDILPPTSAVNIPSSSITFIDV